MAKPVPDYEGQLIEDDENSHHSSNIDVVLVHGIYGNGKNDWPSASSREKIWPIERIFSRLSSEYSWSRTLRYHYNDKVSAPHAISKPGQIRYHAQMLLESLLQNRQGTDRPIVIISDDLGGLIVKQALVMSMLPCSTFIKIVNAVRILIFFGCPHRALSKQQMQDSIFRLLCVGQEPQTGVLERIQLLSSAAFQIHQAFLDTKLPLRITSINVFSTISNLTQQVFDKYSATMDLPFEIQIGINKSHIKLTNDPGDNAGFKKLPYQLGFRPYLFDSDFTPLSFASLFWDSSPLEAISGACSNDVNIYNIATEKVATVQNWVNKRDDCILHIYGKTRAELDTTSRQLYNFLSHRKEYQHEVMFYQLKSNDHRFNTIRRMLSTILTQLASRYKYVTGSIKSYLRNAKEYNIWNTKILYRCWMDICFLHDDIPTIYLISGLDQCKESVKWFLDSLLKDMTVSEGRVKFIIVSQLMPEIQEALQGVTSIDIDSSTTSDINTSPSSSKDSILRSSILGSMPSHLHDCGRKAIALVLGWFQPITKTQLVDILSSGLAKSPDHITEVLLHMTPLFESNEFILALYPDIRNLILIEKPGEGHWYSFASICDVHAEIAELCMEYLISDTIQTKMRNLLSRLKEEPQNQGFYVPIDTDSPLSYAVTQFPEHYQLSSASQHLENRLLNFLSQGDINHWLNFYHLLSHPITRSLTPLSSSPLVISSSFGFNNLVKKFAKHYKDDLSIAITEAVRNGHTEVCRTLIQEWQVSPDPKPQVSVATTPENAACIREFVLHNRTSWFQATMSLSFVTSLWGMIDVLQIPAQRGDPENANLELLNEGLHVAVLYDYPRVVRKMILDGADVNSKNHDGHTCFYEACARGYIDICKILLRAGAHTKVDDIIHSPLGIACRMGKHAIVDLLCKDSKLVRDTDIYSKMSDQLLVLCAKKGFTKSLGALLNARANKNALYSGFGSPLFYAAIGGYVDTCRILLEANALINLHKREITDLLIIATTHADAKLMDMLMRHLKEACGNNGVDGVDHANSLTLYASEALHTAAGRRSLDVIDCLIRWGSDINYCVYGESVLHNAVMAGHTRAVQKLIDHHAKIDTISNQGLTLLQAAHHSVDITTLLLKYAPKVDVKQVTSNGTALQAACLSGSSKVVEILLNHGADPNQEVKEGRRLSPPLLLAVRNGYLDIVQMLLEAGADINVRGLNNDTALHYAFTYRDPERNEQCLRLLLEYYPKLDLANNGGDTPLNRLAEDTPVASIRLMLNAGADPEIPNSNGHTAIVKAILQENVKVAEYIIQKVNIHIITTSVGGLMHVACKYSKVDMVDLLIKRGVDVDQMMDGIAGTPIQAALTRITDFQPQRDIISRLIEAKAKINKKGGQYSYAIIYAFLVSPQEIIELLLEHGADIHVADEFGRNPAHMASLRTIAYIELLKDSPELFRERDILGRNALHYAVGSGHLDVVKLVLELLAMDVDIKDAEGWTPLMWATRCRKVRLYDYVGSETGDEYEAIIKYLVEDCHASISVSAQGLDRQWSPLKLARYHGASKSTQLLLGPPRDTANKQEAKNDRPSSYSDWNEKLHISKKARFYGGFFCNLCLFSLCGVYFQCLHCGKYCLCFRCYVLKENIHPGQLYKNFSDGYESSDSESDDDDDDED